MTEKHRVRLAKTTEYSAASGREREVTHLTIRLLGPFRVSRGSESITDFKSDKVRALLAYLALESQRPHARESLCGLLWSDFQQRSARVNLRSALANLRRVIGDHLAMPSYLDISRQTIQFNSASDAWVDVSAFADLVDPTSRDSEAITRLEEMVELYQGEFLEGFSLPDSPAFEEWALLERERLHRLVTGALYQLSERLTEQGEYEDALRHARRLVHLDPLMEAAHRQVMRLLARSGRRSAALAQYETCRQVLERDLGVEPEEATAALHQRILDGEIAAPESISIPPPQNLPWQDTPFVGREAELQEINQLLQDPACRLLSLVGPGGIGKTRLALQVAHELIENLVRGKAFSDGVFFVPLAGVTAPDQIVSVVADVLSIAFDEEANHRRRLLDFLREKKLLLVLDSFEHLLKGVDLVTEILATAPAVKVLVTSRQSLAVRQEWFRPVDGMRFPVGLGAKTDEESAGLDAYDAITLFVQCARRARSGFSLSEEKPWVVRICQLVEGMPLGIELAASWLKVFPTSKIAQEIEGNLDFLTTSWRDVPARHRSVRAAFEQSWRLLSEFEQRVLARLSVFRGGFSSEAAMAVAEASVLTLGALVEKSLVRRTSADRYQMHELLRQFAADKLHENSLEEEHTAERHGAYYAGFLQKRGKALRGGQQQTALAEINEEIDNARVAWNWAVEGARAAPLDQATDGLCRYFDVRVLPSEGQSACSVAARRLAGTDSAHRLRVRAKVLAWQGYFERLLGQREHAGRLLILGKALLETYELGSLDTRSEKAFLWLKLGDHVLDSDRSVARERYQDSLDLYRALGDRWGMACALEGLARVARGTADYVSAERLLQESMDLRRDLGDMRGVAASLLVSRKILTHLGRDNESFAAAREAVEISKRIGDRTGVVHGLRNLAVSLLLLGDLVEARSMAKQAVSMADELGLPVASAYSYGYLALAEISLGHYENAWVAGQKGLALCRENDLQDRVVWNLQALAVTALAKGEYAEARDLVQRSLVIAREIGQQADVGWGLGILGIAAYSLGELAQARSCLSGALSAAADHRIDLMLQYALSGTALLLADAGDAQRAVEVYSLAASHLSHVANSRWFDDVIGRHIAAAAATLPQDVVTAARERGRARDLWETAEELLAELSA